MIDKPVLTFPEDVAQEVLRRYAEASVILEYGSGGSTVAGAELPHKRIYSVESDPKWLCRLNTYLDISAPKSRPVTYYVDVGPVKQWGHPIDNSGWRDYPDYALAIWDEPFFVHPDLILIDGRFRVGCFLACAQRITRQTVLLFDDYRDRKHYHGVEAVCKPETFVDRMAVFDLKPGLIGAKDLAWIAKSLHIPH